MKLKETTLMKILNVALSIALLSSAAFVARAAEADPVTEVTGGQIKGRLIPGGGATFKAFRSPSLHWATCGGASRRP